MRTPSRTPDVILNPTPAGYATHDGRFHIIRLPAGGYQLRDTYGRQVRRPTVRTIAEARQLIARAIRPEATAGRAALRARCAGDPFHRVPAADDGGM